MLREDSATQQMELMRTLAALQARVFTLGGRSSMSHLSRGGAQPARVAAVLLCLLARLLKSNHFPGPPACRRPTSGKKTCAARCVWRQARNGCTPVLQRVHSCPACTSR